MDYSSLFTQISEQAAQQIQVQMRLWQVNANENASATQSLKIEQWLQLQSQAFYQHSALGNALIHSLNQQTELPEIVNSQDDPRFTDQDWFKNPLYSFIRQTYLINAQLMQDQLETVNFNNEEQANHWRFYIRQLVNATAPSNFAWSNPTVMRETLAQQGENLQKGLKNLLTDLQNSPLEALRVSQVDSSAFELGKNIATSAGKVIYRNELMELIQYAPTTDQVMTTPLLIVPPFINKYYILDLNEKKSLVRWLVDQGFTLFMISWRNPDSEQHAYNFNNYMLDGVLTAMEVVCEICETEQLHAAGYCVGGTLLTATQAWLKAMGREHLKSLTLLTTLLDFSEPGDLGHYLTPEALHALEPLIKSRGLLDGRVLATSFNFLRENDLYWPTFINNYLHGQTPPAFDLLYWNSDPTNLSEGIFHTYVKQFYQHNPFVSEQSLSIDGISVKPQNINTPCYVLSTVKDHIVQWQAAYNSARLLAGPTRFVQAGSGHIAGVINPPSANKYDYKVAQLEADTKQTPAQWQASAKTHTGSWWPDWARWLIQQQPDKTAAREPGNGLFCPLADAPGHYVLKRL